jgi:hypothetical protein
MLLRESLGISADGSEKLYRNDEIEAFEKREGQRLVWIDRDHTLNVQHVFIAVDPSGGGPSAFSIASCLMTATGQINVRATSHPQQRPPSRPYACCVISNADSGHKAYIVEHAATKLSGRWAMPFT